LKTTMMAGCLGLGAVACVGSHAPLTPSPLLVPDAATVPVGESQTFAVENATVVRFTISAERQRWTECVTVDPGEARPNSIRLIAAARCQSVVFITAELDAHPSLMAVMQIE
jgi:hypothetical protein